MSYMQYRNYSCAVICKKIYTYDKCDILWEKQTNCEKM